MNKQTRALAKALQQIMTVIILLTAVVVLIDLRRVSTGIVPPFKDAEGNMLPASVAEKVSVRVNGLDQGLIIRGRDRKNPVILFIQGAPGLPASAFQMTYAPELEDHFTVAFWAGRGSGLSYDVSLEAETVTLEQSVQDAVKVSEYLKARFRQEKIFLLGHGTGSLVGIRTAQARPDLFHAYIGMSQAAGSQLGKESGTLIYSRLKDIFAARDEQASLNRLEHLAEKQADGTVSFRQESLKDLDVLKHRAGTGTMREMRSWAREVLQALSRTPVYTLSEKMDVWRSIKFREGTPFHQEVLKADLLREEVTVPVPVYILSGARDLLNPSPLARRLFDRIQAPLKGFYTFEESAGSPLWEEPEKVIKILIQDVFQKKVELAD